MPEDGERTGVLVIRAWMTRGQPGLIARITGRLEVSSDKETTETVAGAEAAARIASDWLRDFERELP